MKIHWTIISLCIGIICGAAIQLSFANWKIALSAGIISFLLALYFDPKRRYFRAFFIVIALIAGLNKFFFELKGTLFGIDFIVESKENSNGVTIALILLAGICLFLDFLERNGKLKGTFLNYNKNSVVNKNITNSIINNNQTIGKK